MLKFYENQNLDNVKIMLQSLHDDKEKYYEVTTEGNYSNGKLKWLIIRIDLMEEI